MNKSIDKALALKKLDCDNKKSGNPPKVDIFRKVFLGQYLDEALFLMQLIGIRVFSNEKGAAKRKRAKTNSSRSTISIVSPSEESQQNPLPVASEPVMRMIPSLPDSDLKIGAFVYSAMRSLEEAGVSFTKEQIDAMCSSEWSKATFHTSHPFMKRYSPGEDLKGRDGRVRFKKEPYSFGDQQVLITKEWFEPQRKLFIDWFCSLNSIPSATQAETDATDTGCGLRSIPELPDSSMKAGAFVKTAMEQLAASGFEFSDEDMNALCAEGSMNAVIGLQRKLPFFKVFDPNDPNGHIINGRPRFYSKPIVFGRFVVYLNSQIYEKDKEPFIAWYNTLGTPSPLPVKRN